MSAHRHEGRVGAHPDIVQASDTAYGAHTFVTPSRAGITLPSERFCPGDTVTRGEWERRHTAAYKTPKQDQTIDPVETWESHHLSRSPEAPGQYTSGPAAAAATQPCSTGEARSTRDGEGGTPGAAPSHPTASAYQTTNNARAAVTAAPGRDPQELTP